VTGVSLRLAAPADPRRRQALIIVTLAAVIRLVFAAIIPLLPDEAYYWVWSRHLASGYFDHPPVLALLIHSGTVLLAPAGAGDSSLAVRIGAVAAGWIASVATVGVARRLAGDAAALRAAVIMSVLPLAAAGLILATPDAPVLAAVAATLYFVVAAIQSPVDSDESLRWWIAAGFALGVAFCSKYTSIFVPAGVAIAVLARADLRQRLREPGPYVACTIAAIVFLPVLAWNAHHGWVSFVFQVRHGLAAPKGSALLAAWHHEGDFFGGQAGLASPILFVMLAIATARGLTRHAQPERFVLAVVALVSFGFFVYSALRQRVEPNWPSPAYIPAIALLGAIDWSRTGRRWLRGGIALAALLSIAIYAQGIAPILPIAPSKDPVARAFGWGRLADVADSTVTMVRLQTHTATWLAGDRYQEASELAFHVSPHPETFSTNLGGRPNQYDLWPTFPERASAGDNLVLVVDEAPDVHPVVRKLAPYFASVERGPLVMLRRGAGVIGRRRVWVLRAYQGGWPAARSAYSALATRSASLSDLGQQLDQRSLLVLGEARDDDVVGAAHGLVELLEDGKPAIGNEAEHLAAVGRGALAPRQAGLLELIEQPGDAGRFVDHAVADDERRQSVVAGAAQDAQHVVLLRGDAAARDDLCEVPLDDRRRSENAHSHFGARRVKRPTLCDLRLETTPVLRGSRHRQSASLLTLYIPVPSLPFRDLG